MRLRIWRPGVPFRKKKLPEVYEFISGIGIFIEEPDVPRKRRDAEDADLHLLAVVVVRKRAGAHRSGVDRQRDIACRGVVPGGGRQPHDGAAVGFGDERRRIFAAQKIEGPDRIVQDVAARGVDLRNGHLAAAVVDLAAHGSVGENLRVAQHEVIAVAFHDIAAAGFVVARDDPELHAVAVHRTESRRKAFQYLRGTRLRRIALQYAAKQYGNETMKNEKFSSSHSVSSRNFQFLIFNS